ncbi:MAG: response regulator transcription factor [Nitrospirota bacterium]
MMEKKTILLVDDDPVVRDVIKGALEREYDVLEASGYQEVIKQLTKPVDLALIDYILPDRDGFEVLKALREIKPALPAIIMTGYSSEKVAIKALRSAVADYIKKPISLKYLRRRLSEIVGGKWTNESNEHLETREEFILDGIAAYIRENYMKDLTLDNLAKMACMSRFKLSRSFKDRFGKTFTSYLNSIRVKNALELLKNPNINIAEAAHLVGYKSGRYLNRIVKAVYKMSPTEYRKKNIEQLNEGEISIENAL